MMSMLNRIAAAAACALLLAGSASAQLIGSGHVMGNGTASPAAPTDTSLSSVLDQSGSGITRAGNTNKLATVSGAIANGHCRSTDSNGNDIDAGGACTTGGGGGTVNAGTASQVAYYASTGPAVSGNACTVTAGGILTCPNFTFGNSSANGFAASDQTLWAVGTYTGSGAGPFAEFSVTDTAGNPTAGTSLTGINVDYSINSGAAAGNRTGIQAILNHNVAVPGTNGQLKFYTGMFPQAYANTPDGGTSGSPMGALYGLGVISQLNAGATNWEGVGSEIDTAVLPGASVAHKSVLALISVNGDAVAGSVSDAMLDFTEDGLSPAKWHFGIAFGRPDSNWPFGSGSILIGTYAPVTGTRTAGEGIDLSGVTFSGAAIATPGFTVDNVGNVTGNTLASGANVFAAGYVAAGHAGVTCAGINAATVVVTGGIITHC